MKQVAEISPRPAMPNAIRFDLTFFILRLDMAFPLAVPYRERSGFFEPVQPLKRQWRRDNLVFNLAIGYPF